MALVAQILRTYVKPREVIRARLAEGRGEGPALAILMAAALLIFIAQWPVAARAASLEPTVPFDARIGGALFGILFLLPPICYLAAAISHLVARGLGAGGDFFGARLAFFWSLLCIAPLMLVQGLVAAFLGQGLPATILGLAIAAAFLWIWLNTLIEAEKWT